MYTSWCVGKSTCGSTLPDFSSCDTKGDKNTSEAGSKRRTIAYKAEMFESILIVIFGYQFSLYTH